MNQKLIKKLSSGYLRYRDYFLAYQLQNRPPRKFPYCVVCGQPNVPRLGKKRLVKTCSRACSGIWKRVVQQKHQRRTISLK